MPSLPVDVPRPERWHRPLLVLAAACLVVLAGCVVGLAVDPRRLTGAPIWLKPAKFAVSIAVCAATLAWLLPLLRRRRRLVSVLGSVVAAMLAGELVVIVLQVGRGRTSHFDLATPLDAGLWQAMAVMIGVLWLSNVALAVLLLREQVADRAVAWALRLGMLLAVLGMAVAYLMTLPTPAQRRAWDGGAPVTVVGAHTVGVPDGGPGLPLVGWSTVGGDLRVPHFVGLHGLQVLVLLAIGLTALAPRVPRLTEAVRLRLVLVVAAGYAGLLGVLTWQALRGQSVAHPDAATVAVSAGVLLAALVAAALVVGRGRPGALHPPAPAAA